MLTTSVAIQDLNAAWDRRVEFQAEQAAELASTRHQLEAARHDLETERACHQVEIADFMNRDAEAGRKIALALNATVEERDALRVERDQLLWERNQAQATPSTPRTVLGAPRAPHQHSGSKPRDTSQPSLSKSRSPGVASEPNATAGDAGMNSSHGIYDLALGGLKLGSARAGSSSSQSMSPDASLSQSSSRGKSVSPKEGSQTGDRARRGTGASAEPVKYPQHAAGIAIGDSLFDRADLNRDGVIDRAEFQALLRHTPRKTTPPPTSPSVNVPVNEMEPRCWVCYRGGDLVSCCDCVSKFAHKKCVAGWMDMMAGTAVAESCGTCGAKFAV